MCVVCEIVGGWVIDEAG